MKSTFARKTPFKKKNTNIFAFRHAGCPLPCRLEPNFERPPKHEYATKFGKILDLKSGNKWKSKIESSSWFSKNNITLLFTFWVCHSKKLLLWSLPAALLWTGNVPPPLCIFPRSYQFPVIDSHSCLCVASIENDV